MESLLQSLSASAQRVGSVDFTAAPSHLHNKLRIRQATVDERAALAKLAAFEANPLSLLRKDLVAAACSGGGSTASTGETIDPSALTPKSLKRKADSLFDKLEAAAKTTASGSDELDVQQLRAKYAGMLSACRALRRKIAVQTSGEGEGKGEDKMDAENNAQSINEQEAEETKHALEEAKKTTATLKSAIIAAEAEEKKQGEQHQQVVQDIEQKEEQVALLNEQLRKHKEDLANLRTVIVTVQSSQSRPPAEGEQEDEESKKRKDAQDAAEATCVQLREQLSKLEAEAAKVCETDSETQQICEELRSVRAQVQEASEKLKAAETQGDQAKSITLKLIENLDSSKDPHVRALKLLNDNSGEMALDDLKGAVGLKAIYTLVANALIRIDRTQSPNTALLLL